MSNTFVLAALKRWLVEQYDTDKYQVIRYADILAKIADIEAGYELNLAEVIGVDDDDEDEDEKEGNDESVSD